MLGQRVKKYEFFWREDTIHNILLYVQVPCPLGSVLISWSTYSKDCRQPAKVGDITAAAQACCHGCRGVAGSEWQDLHLWAPAGTARLGNPGALCSSSSHRWLGLRGRRTFTTYIGKGSFVKQTVLHDSVWKGCMCVHTPVIILQYLQGKNLTWQPTVGQEEGGLPF